MDLSPLKKYPEYRKLYFGQLISYLGSALTNVTVPYHVYQLTKSTALTGLIGIFYLIPMLIGGLIGGAIADAFERKKVILICNAGLVVCCSLLSWYASTQNQNYLIIFSIASAMALLSSLMRPSLEAITPQLVPKIEMPSVAALNSLRFNVGAIIGPGVAGVLLATYGSSFNYALDAISYFICMIFIIKIKNLKILSDKISFQFKALLDGFRYASTRKDLIGTYLIDIIAMAFCMPSILFPAIAESYGSAKYLGFFHSAISVGAVIATLTSSWTKTQTKHGLLVAYAAIAWCISMIFFGLSNNIFLCLFFLALAGFADMISSIFRSTIWNQSIPDSIRGRMAGIEMISFLSGPHIGNLQLGYFAESFGAQRAVKISSFIGLILLGASTYALPSFRNYDSRKYTDKST